MSKDGQTIATASADKTARTWNAADGKPKLVYELGAPAASVAFAPDGKALAVGLADGSARAFDLTATDPVKAERAAIPGQGGAVHALAVTPDGASLVTGSDDKNVRLWPLGAGGPKVLNGHTAQVYAVAWSADGNQVVTGGGEPPRRGSGTSPRGRKSARSTRRIRRPSTPSCSTRRANTS